MVNSALLGLFGSQSLRAEQASRETSPRIECKVRTLTRDRSIISLVITGYAPGISRAGVSSAWRAVFRTVCQLLAKPRSSVWSIHRQADSEK